MVYGATPFHHIRNMMAKMRVTQPRKLPQTTRCIHTASSHSLTVGRAR
jgi:hypothetical protein